MHNKPIRILHMVASLNRGGSQSMLMNIYRCIDRKRVQFDFIIDHDEDALREEIESMGGRIYKLPDFKGYNFISILKAWDQFFCNHTEYRVLHTHSRSYASVYLPIAKKHGLITVCHSHSTSNGSGLKSKIKDIMQLPIRFEADYFFACSIEAGRWLYGEKVCNGRNFKVIPNCIEINHFLFDKSVRDEIRENLHITDEIVIGNVGRITTPKNQEFLLDIIWCLNSMGEKKYKLLIVGDGDLFNVLLAKTHELGIEDYVIFVGEVRDPEKYYNAMDLFAFPSIWEGFPVSVIEAQVNGLECMISSAVTNDVKITDKCNFYSLSEKPAGWAKTIKSLSVSPMDRNALSIDEIEKFDAEKVSVYLSNFYRMVYQGGLSERN